MAYQRFLVSCVYCHRAVALVPRIGEPELLHLQAHRAVCRPRAALGPSPGVEATLRHFRVASADPDDEPRREDSTSQETTKEAPTPAEREYLDLKELKVYSGSSIRKLRALLRDLANPIPSISLGRMIRVYKPAFDAWMANHQTVDLKRVLDEVRSARRKVTS